MSYKQVHELQETLTALIARHGIDMADEANVGGRVGGCRMQRVCACVCVSVE